MNRILNSISFFVFLFFLCSCGKEYSSEFDDYVGDWRGGTNDTRIIINANGTGSIQQDDGAGIKSITGKVIFRKATSGYPQLIFEKNKLNRVKFDVHSEPHLDTDYLGNGDTAWVMAISPVRNMQWPVGEVHHDP